MRTLRPSLIFSAESAPQVMYVTPRIKLFVGIHRPLIVAIVSLAIAR